MNINKALIVGRITKDIELKKLPSGSSVCSFSVATNETYTKDGNKVETTEFHNIVCFGKTADNVSRYMCKGCEIFIEGKLQTRTWEKDGQKHYRNEIIAQNVQFGAKPNGAKKVEKEDSVAVGPDDVIEYPDGEISPEDIPF